MFNKETGKRQSLTFHGNGCKEGKNMLHLQQEPCIFKLPLRKLS